MARTSTTRSHLVGVHLGKDRKLARELRTGLRRYGKPPVLYRDRTKYTRKEKHKCGTL